MRQFEGLGKAIPGRKGRYLGSGKLDLLVSEVKMGGLQGNYFIVELYVLDCDDAVDDAGKSFAPGDEACWMTDLNIGAKLGTRPEDNPAIKDIKGFCLALAEDVDPDEIDEAFGVDLVGPKQPARGVILHATGITKPQKKDPSKDYTFVRWEPSSASTRERYAERAKELLA